VLSRKFSTDSGLNLCSIIRKLHLYACVRLNSRSLGKIGAEIAVLSWKNFFCQRTTARSINRKLHLCSCARLSSRYFGKVGAEIALLPGKNSVMGPQHCSINRKMHLCASARPSSRSLGKIVAEIAVLSWNNFYCQGTTALFHNQETTPLRMRPTKLALSWEVKC
jgi:uncharacterized protein YbgA (DUF1722 family)